MGRACGLGHIKPLQTCRQIAAVESIACAGAVERAHKIRGDHVLARFMRQHDRAAAVLSRGMILRIAGVALVTQVLTVNATVLPLIITGRANGAASDIGFLVGLVALLEVIFMIFWVSALRYMRLTTALAISAVLYLVYLSAIAAATAPWHVYAASVIAGISAAGIISLPISYLLDLIRNRPGLSASLIAVNMFLGAALGSGVFALGAALSGYGLASVLSGGAGVIGALMLVYLERQRP